MDEYYELFMQTVQDFSLYAYIFILGGVYTTGLMHLYTHE